MIAQSKYKIFNHLLGYLPKWGNSFLGICYIFNFGNDFKLKSMAAGKTYGLQLDIDIESKYYLGNGLSEYEGKIIKKI